MRTRIAAVTLLALSFGACGKDTPVGPDRNRSPEIRSFSVTPSVIPLGGTAAVSVDAVDPDGDQLFYRFEAAAGSISADPGQPSRATYRNDGVARGSDQVRVTVTDSNNASASGVASVTLQGNRAPTVSVSSPVSERSCHPRCTLTVEAAAQDADNDALSYTWSGCASGGNSSARCAINQPGSYTASVLVEDGRGGVATASITLDGTNRAPIVTGGRTFHGVGPERFLTTNEDPDGDEQVCGWWGSCQCTGSVQSYNLVCSMPAELSTCFERFTCTDPFGATGETRFELVR